MSSNVTRLTEDYLCAILNAQEMGITFYPNQGLGTNDTEISPPFGVVTINDANSEYDQLEVYTCIGSVQVITNSYDTTTEAGSALIDRVRLAISYLPATATPGYAFSGLSINKQRHADMEGTQVQSDIIDFSLGASTSS